MAAAEETKGGVIGAGEVDNGGGGGGGGGGGEVSLREWQGWGTSSPVPAMVTEVIRELRALELETDSSMRFGGLGGKLQGEFKVQEDKKHRKVYDSLTDSERKLQFFAARQIACRLLGSRGYLCQKCWLPKEDCMCSRIVPCSLWDGIRFWLYMHPKDFLRQNNTGKLLWQIFGTQAATLCLFGITEHEEIMWHAFSHAGNKRKGTKGRRLAMSHDMNFFFSLGKGMVWLLYPNKNLFPKSVQDIVIDGVFRKTGGHDMDLGDEPLNFVLIDGTWSNSAAMYKRLKERWKLTWGDEDLPCISLSTLGASVMHKLRRPQPSWDRTCTAAAAAGLLSELHLRPQLSTLRLDKQAEAVEQALDFLLDSLTSRRLRMGRSITRRERHKNCV
uniref:tRNA-uridine aminocarboxypropyltransferase n=1 Tax=Ananas comosus var. bracteatus TaxID=296719 RepID=A0A6V7Q7W2_ANACO|nr:unnamed protein product [Ananas comosus var. bracteatus]